MKNKKKKIRSYKHIEYDLETEEYFIVWKTKDGILHSNNGPAIEYEDGDLEYYYNGKLHNENGPADISIVLDNYEYYIDGLCHRIDGPAIIRRGFSSKQIIYAYYINGYQLSPTEYLAYIKDYLPYLSPQFSLIS